MRALEGKVVLVIGGTRSISASISRRMVADGASVAIVFLSRSVEAEDFASTLRDGGATVLLIQADVSDPDALTEAIDKVVRRFGHIDILVTVAGMAIVGSLYSYPDNAFDRTFALNVRAPFIAAQRAAATMPDNGRIITIGSIVAERLPDDGGTLYAASKAALGGLTRGPGARSRRAGHHGKPRAAGADRYGTQSGRRSQRGRQP